MRRVCEFAGIEFSPGVLEYTQGGEEASQQFLFRRQRRYRPRRADALPRYPCRRRRWPISRQHCLPQLFWPGSGEDDTVRRSPGRFLALRAGTVVEARCLGPEQPRQLVHRNVTACALSASVASGRSTARVLPDPPFEVPVDLRGHCQYLVFLRCVGMGLRSGSYTVMR